MKAGGAGWPNKGYPSAKGYYIQVVYSSANYDTNHVNIHAVLTALAVGLLLHKLAGIRPGTTHGWRSEDKMAS
eukprot:scaffold206478_cov33-Tisochrysis_lutea.AAC.5